MSDVSFIICDSAAKLEERHRGAVVVCGSHGGTYAAYLAARAGVRAVVLCDAGVGRERAGIACLEYCEALGMACATSAHDSARIGDGADILRRGRISHVNAIAGSSGCAPGQAVRRAQELLAEAPMWEGDPPPCREGRTVVRDAPGRPRAVCLDSASLVAPEDAGQIVITGSHGGLPGGEPKAALRIDALAAIFNDAGIGADDAGIQRLPTLDRRGIAAATVGAMSARIGDGLSTWRDGVLSRVNDAGRGLGAREGMRTTAFVDLLLRHAAHAEEPGRRGTRSS